MYDPVEVATYYVALFPARTDVYSRWTPEVNGWRPVREELTAEIALAGITRKGPPISGYMIAPGSVSHSLAVDFDTANGFEQASVLARTMTAAGLPAYVETSRRGAHLWAIFDQQIEAKLIRRATRAFFASALLPTEDPHLEIRPGSDTVDAEWHEHVQGVVVGAGLGHCIRLPFMPHPKTGRQPQFLDAEGNIMGPSIAQILLDIETGPAGVIEAWAQKWSPVTTFIPKSYRPPGDFGPDEYENASASEILRTLWGVANAQPGKAVRCPAHDDRVPSLSILRDDRRVICKSPSCELNNGDHGRGTYELTKLAPTAVP